jgi:general nucleoside transport system permease protein
VTETVEPSASPDPEQPGPPSVASHLALYQRAGGIATPLVTTLFAFFVGGLVVLATTHKNPLNTYREIFNGTGLSWFLHVGSYKVGLPFTDSKVWFPWDTHARAAENLQFMLVVWLVPLILTGLAVAFAFRCGLFNIGGQGQYLAGAFVAVWVGTSFTGMAGAPHALLAIVAAAIAGAVLAGIAGLLKATVGAHEVITTIMLNWIVIWSGKYLFGFGGPLQNDDPLRSSLAQSADVPKNTWLKVFWGDAGFQGLHVGIFLSVAALVVYWAVLNRTTLGYQVRAVGFNPDAARYGGISVGRNYFLAMAISGAFAGLAGGMDILGWLFRVDQTSVQISSQIAFIGIAVALLGRNTPLGIFFAALLFGALQNGTSTRNLDPAVFQPELAGNLALVIQGLVVLFVGADLLILYLWRARSKLRRKQAQAAQQT